MSESIEMYLVMTALLRGAPDQPVAVSLLANKLGVTQVSANEMCHKLSERGLMAYQPYKGVTLTETGEEQAQEILSRRRLWVVFLVENLGIEPDEADQLACQLEHITSERLVVALKSFLERPTPARCPYAEQPEPVIAPPQPLTNCVAGTQGQIVALNVPAMSATFLQAQGVSLGSQAEVLAVGGDGSVLLAVAGHHVSLAAPVATQIMIATTPLLPTPRHEAWMRCSAFWACPKGKECSRGEAESISLTPFSESHAN
ncbi:metal-dependent transcriptional regulator [Candidatus Oscillochloris fontis]|uniref:metal-dependent transcriptional regulator n=1 Tax=Candidatus Oscillochloris fontis TaxID=2496868 RepID=UPI00101DD32E|nr:metal-dependent transcriptional regulator [Candidatus Oscillochloris fontis]